MAGMKFNADIDLKNIVKLRQEIDKLKKSLIEIASVPNSDAAVKALEKQLASALKKLDKYKDKYVQTQQARIDQEKAASEQIKKQQKEIDSLIKKYEALQKQIEKGTGRAPRSPKTYTDDQISVALKTQVQSIKEAREQLKVLRFAQANVTDQQERETGARTKLNIKIQENTRYLKLNSDAYTRQKMEIGNYEENIRRALDGTGQFNLSLSKMLGVIGGTAALKGLVTDMINVRGEFQKTSIAFETMLGSKEKADALMAQMVETAAKTPFDLQGVTSGAKQLLAYGTSADKVNETLVRLGNIASGLSIPLGELVYLYGTSMSQGRLFTQDVNQFMGRGIPLVAELSKELGKTESEIRKMVTEGKVGFPELQKVIENMTNEGGKFYNLMEMQSTTLSGQISNLGDAWDSMLNSIGEDTQGIASMTISAATSIIENYDKVGKIILSIAATYGTYKAALIAVELYERRAAAARLLHIKIIRAQAVAQAALNLVSKANPYVLLATAIVGVTTAMWALHDSTTTTEREMERISKRTEVYNKYLQDEKNHVNELISVLQNENSTKKERIEAFNELQTKYPQYFGKYKTEKELIDHLTESLKGYNEQLRIRQELMNVKNNNDDIKRYKELEKFLSLARKGKDQRTSVEESDFNFYLKKYDVRKRGIGVTVEEYIQEMLASLSATIGEGQEIIRKQEQTAWEVALDSMDKTTAEGHKKMLEGYKILLRESGKEWIKIEGSEAPVNADILTNRIKQLNDKILNVEWKNAETYRKEAKIAWEKAKKEVEDVKSGKATYKSEADYQKALKEKQDAESEAEKRYKNLGGVTGNELSKQEKEAEKRKKEQEKLNEDLLSLRRQNQQAEIDLMKEGTEKKLKQIDLDYQKELDAIKKQEKDLSERQGGKLTSEQSIEISARYTNAENKREKDISNVIKEQLKTEQQALNDYLKEYGTFQEKKLAITREYEEKIKKAQNQWEAKSLQKELEETISSINLSELKQNFNWDAIFGNLSLYSSKKLKELRTQLKDLLENDKSLSVSDKTALIEQYNRLGDAIIKDQNALGKLFGYKTEQQNQVQLLKEEYELRKNIYDKLVEEQQIIQKRYSDSKTNLESFLKGKGFGADTSTMDVDKILSMFSSSDVEGMEKFQSLFSAFSKSGKELSNITSQVDKAGKSMDGASEAFQGAGSNMASTVSMIDTIVHGINDNVQSANELIKILELEDTKFGEGFDSFAKSSQYATQAWESLKSGNIMGVAAGVAGSIKELGNAIGSWFGLNANYSDYNEMVAKYDVLLDVWDQLKKKKKAYINESYGAEATKAGKEALDLLKAERDITRELASSRLDAGAGAGSHSMAYRMWQGSYKYEGQNWKDVAGEISSALGGVEFSSMWNLLYMSADQLEWIKTNYSGLWSQMDTDFRGYLDDIIQYGETEAEIIESVKEQITGISFDSFRDSYVSLLSDLDSTNKDFADSFEEYLRKSILQSVIAKNYDTKIQELYDSWSKAGEDGLFSESEVDRLRSMQQSITDAMLAERNRLEEVFGWSSSSSQEASKKGFATASQDSIDELNGRFTALQIAGEEIKNQNQLQTMSILELRADMLPIIANTTGIKDIASETRDLLRLSYEAIVDIRDNTNVIVKPIQQMALDIAEVKRNTSKL